MCSYNIICGSGSKQRYAAIQKLTDVASIRVMKPHVDETAMGSHLREEGKAEELVLQLGKAKADWILNHVDRSSSDLLGKEWIIATGDTVVVHNGIILEKPDNEQDVYAFYDAYNTKDTEGCLKPIRVVGSVVVTELNTQRQLCTVDSAELVFMEPMPLSHIPCVISDAMNSAGGLIVEHPLIAPRVKLLRGTIDSIKGLDPNTLKRLMDHIVHDSTNVDSPPKTGAQL